MHGFIGLLKPVHDETLSSWISRMYHKKYFDGSLIAAFDEIVARDPCAKGDFDFLYKSPTFLSYFSPPQQCEITLSFQLPEFGVAQPTCSGKYCPACFEEDVRNLLVPIWRKSWRISGASVCTNHLRPVLLSRLIKYPNDLRERGWQAFKEHLESPASRLLTNFPIMSTSPTQAVVINEQLLFLVKKVQRWYQASSISQILSHSNSSLKFLLGVWLHQPDPPRLSAGIARAYFQSSTERQNRSLSEKITAPAVSIDTASPRDLAVAYWLLGVSYGVISHKEACFIRDVTRSRSSQFPTTRLQVASATTKNYLDYGMALLIDEARSSLVLEEFREASWVLVRLLGVAN